MTVNSDSCAFPAVEAGSTRTWRSPHGLVIGAVWALLGLMGAALLVGDGRFALAGAGLSGVMAAAMTLARKAWTLERLQRGSGMNARAFGLFWNGQILSNALGVGVLGVAGGGLHHAGGTALLVFAVSTTLLALLTPFCLGRFLYLVLSERRAPR